MSKQLISESKVEAVTLDSVFESIQHWREHKEAYPSRAIPDEIWKKIFILAAQGKYKSESLRQLFKLNSAQYNRKYQALNGELSSARPVSNSSVEDKATSSTSPAFGEAIINPAIDKPTLQAAADKTKQAVKVLKSTKPFETSLLDPTTAVVECIRSDGHRLKIHITTQYLDAIVETFFSQANPS